MSTRTELNKLRKPQLVSKVQELEKQLKQRQSVPQSERKAQEQKEGEILEAMSDVTEEGIVQQFTSMDLNLRNVLNSASDKVRQSFDRVRMMEDAYQIKERQLAELHDKELVLKSTEELVDQFKELLASSEAEFQLKVQAHEQDLRALTENYEERNRSLSKSYQRKTEELEDTYRRRGLELKRTHEEQDRALTIELRDRRAEFESEVSERTRDLNDREEELEKQATALQVQAADLEAMTEKAVSSVRKSLSQQFAHEKALMESQTNAEINLLRSQLESLTEENARLHRDYESVTAKLEKAEDRVTQIAQSAIQEAGTSRALDIAQKYSQQLSSNGTSTRAKA